MTTQPESLATAFREALALPKAFDVRSVAYDKTSQWDSVAHLLLVTAIEDSFDVRLEPAEVIDLQSYDTAVAILKTHGVWADA
jgi:hypothetical protein